MNIVVGMGKEELGRLMLKVIIENRGGDLSPEDIDAMPAQELYSRLELCGYEWDISIWRRPFRPSLPYTT